MHHIIRALVAMAVLLGTAAVVAPVVAHTGDDDYWPEPLGVKVKHWSDKGDWDPSIPIRCEANDEENDSKHYVREGQKSNVDHEPCPSVMELYVWADTELWCLRVVGAKATKWVKVLDARGWRDVYLNLNPGAGCKFRRD